MPSLGNTSQPARVGRVSKQLVTTSALDNLRLKLSKQSCLPLQELDNKVRLSQASAYAEGTLANLTNQWVRYLSSCILYNEPVLPATEHSLSRFAQHLGESLKAHESILNYLSGVKTLHILLDLPVQAFKHVMLRLTLRGMRRLNTFRSNPAPPVTVQILDDIFKLLNMQDEEDCIFWAVILIGFFLLLRKCNLVPDTSAKFDPVKQLKRSDIQIDADHIKVTLRWTKNNQFGEEALRFALPLIEDSNLCPVTALLRVLMMVRGRDTDSLFRRSDGSVYSYRNLQSKLQVISDKLQLPRKLTSHSLRAGGATAAFLAGVPPEIIKIMGHWKSDCFRRYLRFPEEARLAAGILMRNRIKCLNY